MQRTEERPPGPALMPLFLMAKCVMSTDITRPLAAGSMAACHRPGTAPPSEHDQKRSQLPRKPCRPAVLCTVGQ